MLIARRLSWECDRRVHPSPCAIPENSPVVLDGNVVSELIGYADQKGGELIAFMDRWLNTH